MTKWACNEAPEIILDPIEPTRFDQLLVEISSILYDSYIKIHHSKALAEKPRKKLRNNHKQPENNLDSRKEI